MKKITTFCTTIIAFVLFVYFVQAQGSSGGCCCTPPAYTGFFATSASACPAGNNFTSTIPIAPQTCNDVCNATFLQPLNVTFPLDCSSPLYKPVPTNFIIKPVKGQKQLQLTFSLPCPALSVDIARCAGTGCTDFKPLAQIAPNLAYNDVDPNLLWNQIYTYKIVAHYVKSGASQPATSSGNAGDIECWNQGTSQFCIAQFYYSFFEEYLKQHGYGTKTKLEFGQSFDATVDAVFGGRFNKGWYCNDQNLLGVPQSQAVCGQNQFCVADDAGTQCKTKSPCNIGGLFGLYASVDTCENLDFCFFDRSKTSVDACFACDQSMRCADYRTKGACERDNCNAGECEWHNVFSNIGTGMCVDKRSSNCKWCKTNGTIGMENNEAYNEVFDQCTAQKANALSVPNYPCVYNKNAQEGVGCDAAACMDYTIDTCGSPVQGITLKTDNSFATTSADICNIKVCQTMGNSGCTKNGDGNAVPDCSPNDPDRRLCELDYFAPNTTLVASAYKPESIDWLAVKMLDKLNATHVGEFMQGKPGYQLHVCVVGQNNQCNNAATFAVTNLSMLNLNDLSLQAGKTVLAPLVVGQNTLKFYGVDSRNNVEVVKESTILACNLCQGPKVIETTITPSKKFDNTYYTASNLPVITVSFNEPAILTSAILQKGNTGIQLTTLPGNSVNYDYTFMPLTQLADGTYTLTFNAKDNNNLGMDVPGVITFIVDTTPGNVLIEPADGVVINTTAVPITFTFQEQTPVTVSSAVLEQEVWISKYAARRIITNLSLTQSGDNVYTTTVSGLGTGKKNLRIEAEDAAGNKIIGKSSFWVNTGTGDLQLRLREPSWGVSNAYAFDVVIDTSRPANCKYVYDSPTAPPTSFFDAGALATFPQSTGITHSIPNFDKITSGDLSKHKLHVYCKLGTTIKQETFELSVDQSLPKIIAAFAQPKIVIERLVPDQNIFTTTLKVQTDDESFCRHSTQNVPFVLMSGFFPGYEEMPKKAHDIEINVTEENTTYNFYVACKNTAETPSQTVPVTFSVDLSQPFAAQSTVPPYSNVTAFNLRIESNKRSFCYVGETSDAIQTCMGECDFGYSHMHPVSVNSSGNYTWYAKCSTGAGAEVSPVIQMPFIVDTTPPVMIYVNDSSNLPSNPETSYFLDRLQVAFFGNDNETAVNAYYYRVLSFFSNDVVVNWTLSTITNGTTFWITGLNLTNGNKYKIEVYPVNIVGLQGTAVASDGVTIDTTKMPDLCDNGIKDQGETGIDCGGPCSQCLDGQVCTANTDCSSGFCNNGACAVSGCDDGVKNDNETDVDCGGSTCLTCSANKTCVADSDCSSGSCNFGTCGDMSQCRNGVLTDTETDVDCGGSCPNACGSGKNCKTLVDCAQGLFCIDSTCQSEHDADADGIADSSDQCPNTPNDEVPDETGCSPSQKRSCGDEISDGWRVRYFDSILCDGDGATNADSDNDGVSNIEEFNSGTNPKEADSDFDGWDDGEEIDAGTSPIDPESHPASKFRIFLWILLVILILAMLGFGGYFGYRYYQEKKAAEVIVPVTKPKPVKPVVLPARKVEVPVIGALRKIARKEEPGVVDRDWVSLGELTERLQKEKVPVSEDVFKRLKDFTQGKVSKQETKGIISAIQKEPEAFSLLRKITFEKLSLTEREQIKRYVSKMKAGKLTPAEQEALLSRLRVTAAYYKMHKSKIEQELAEWLGEGKK